MQAYPEVNYRYWVYPSQPLPDGCGMLNFDPVKCTTPL